jgi:hypothetical protein
MHMVDQVAMVLGDPIDEAASRSFVVLAVVCRPVLVPYTVAKLHVDAIHGTTVAAQDVVDVMHRD